MPSDSRPKTQNRPQSKRLSHQKEVELTRRVANGDDSAWEELQSAFYLGITGFFAGHGCLGEAESLANLSMWRSYRLVRANKYNPAFRFYTFLRMVSTGILSEHRRAQKRNRRTETFTDLLSRFSQGDKEVSYDDLINVIVEPVLPPPEDRMDELRELMELVFVCCAKPHQILAFGFVKLLGWKPKHLVVDLIGQKKIGELSERLCDDYYQEAEVLFSKDEFKKIIFARFFEKINKLVSQIYQEKEYAKLVDYVNEIVKDIPFELFFTNRDRSASISDWCKKVANRTQYLVTNSKPCKDERL